MINIFSERVELMIKDGVFFDGKDEKIFKQDWDWRISIPFN